MLCFSILNKKRLGRYKEQRAFVTDLPQVTNNAIFFKDKPSTFILMFSLLPTFASLLLMSFVRIYKARIVDDEKHLSAFPAVVAVFFYLDYYVVKYDLCLRILSEFVLIQAQVWACDFLKELFFFFFSSSLFFFIETVQ